MVSRLLFSAFLLALGLERLYELSLSRRNQAWALSQGGVEYGAAHFRFMKALHGAFLLGCGAEVWWLNRSFEPALGWACLGLSLLAQALRYWAIRTLGPRWNVRILVVPGMPVVTGGPFRYCRHPNYLAVIVEGVVVPLVHSAWVTALAFSLLNAWLLRVRIRAEEAALTEHCRFHQNLGHRPRLVPRARA